MALPTTTNVSRPRAFGYGVRLGELYLRLGIGKDSPLDIVTAPLQAPAVNTASSAEDIRNEFGQIFSRVDFTGGAGLDYAHKRNATELDTSRFWDSWHVDVSNPTPGHPAKITLLPPTANIETSADANLHLAYDGTAIYMAEGSAGNTRRAANFTATTPTFADSASGAATTITDLTSLGADVYAATGTGGIEKRTGGSWSGFSATHTVRVWGVKRQLLAAASTDASLLVSVNLGTGAHTTLVTLSAGQEWRDVADCGQAILAAADDGAIYALGFNTSGAAGGTLELKAQSVLGGTEIPYALGYDGTFVYYATREATPSGAIGRFYRAQLAENYVLTDAVLLRQWGDQSATIDHCPRRIIATRDAVFTGVYETSGSFLWRYDRATTGLTRHLDLVASGIVVDILALSGRLFATVAGHGLRREAVGSYEDEGYLIGPLADFFTAANKSWAGALIDHDAIVGSEVIELYYSTDPEALVDPDSTTWHRVKNITGGRDTLETALAGVEARYLAGMVRLYADTDAATAPAVRTFSFRAYPGEGDVEVTFSANVGDTVERAGFKRQRVRGLGDSIYDALKGIEGAATELEILRTGEVFQGVVEQVGIRIGHAARGGALADMATVKFRGRRAPRAAATSTSEGMFGVGMFGVMGFGGAEVAA